MLPPNFRGHSVRRWAPGGTDARICRVCGLGVLAFRRLLRKLLSARPRSQAAFAAAPEPAPAPTPGIASAGDALSVAAAKAWADASAAAAAVNSAAGAAAAAKPLPTRSEAAAAAEARAGAEKSFFARLTPLNYGVAAVTVGLLVAARFAGAGGGRHAAQPPANSAPVAATTSKRAPGTAPLPASDAAKSSRA